MFNIDEPTISNINKGKIYFDASLKYPLRYYNKASDLNYNKLERSYINRNKKCPLCGKKIGVQSKFCLKCSRKFIKPLNISREELLGSLYNLKSI